MSGLIDVNFQSSRNVPIVRDWFTMMVMVCKIVFLNLSRILVLQRSVVHVNGFILFVMLRFLSFSQWYKASKFCAFSIISVMLVLLLELFFVFEILFRRKSAYWFFVEKTSVKQSMKCKVCSNFQMQMYLPVEASSGQEQYFIRSALHIQLYICSFAV